MKCLYAYDITLKEDIKYIKRNLFSKCIFLLKVFNCIEKDWRVQSKWWNSHISLTSMPTTCDDDWS